MTDAFLPTIGTRFNLNAHIGTVRFVGQVENTTGSWIGVEWDDPTRGKHDGCKDGKRYFTCRFKTAGSFIRPTADIQYGVSFLEALASKYIEALHGTKTQERIVLGSSGGAIEVEAVSLDKIRQKCARLDRLREVSLDNANIIRADPPGHILQTCSNIRGLDLSQNLFQTWDAVAEITKELPFLQRLSLNRNRLSTPSSSEKMAGACEKLLELQLNNTLMTWYEIRPIMMSMPCLQSVEMGYNYLSQLSTSPDVLAHPTLQSLNLDTNSFSDWVHVCSSLIMCKSLQRLVLPNNVIESIPFPFVRSENLSLPLSSVQSLSLSDNRISSWSSLDALSIWMPDLRSLSIRGNALVNHGKDDERHARSFTIARIPSLVTLDGTRISSRERTDSELYYMSHIIQQGYPSEEQRRKEHYRWIELCDKHGRPNELWRQNNLHDKLSNRLIDLGLYPYTDGFMLDLSERFTLQVLPSMSLRILRAKICKYLKHDVRRTQMRCWLRMRDGSLTELETKEDSKDLDWLGIENGSQIIYEILQ